jgi:hypothetical protein
VQLVCFLTHVKHRGVTHDHVGIGYHIKLDGPATPFDTHNESRHTDWNDSNMSRATLLVLA